MSRLIDSEKERTVAGMDDYIRREEAIDAVLDTYFNTPKINLIGKLFYDAILKLQPVDVAQVKHGRWVIPTKIGHRSFDIPHCSVCNDIPCGVNRNTNYCPNCGAKMDGDDNDD